MEKDHKVIQYAKDESILSEIGKEVGKSILKESWNLCRQILMSSIKK